MDMNSIKTILRNKSLHLEKSIFDHLSHMKADAVANNDEQLANEIWFYETVATIQSDFLHIYLVLKADEYGKYLDAWNILEHIEIAFSNIRNNYPDWMDEFNLPFIETTVFYLQRMFPYRVFMSREMVIKASECSICHKKTSIRNPCPHKTGKLYDGEMCCTSITYGDFISMNIVTKPFDKYCVPIFEGIKYNYYLLQRLMDNWNSPYEEWHLDIQNVKRTEYKNVGRNSKCPCGSEKKYKRCCYNTEKELMEHFRLTFNNKAFAETPINVINTNIKEIS